MARVYVVIRVIFFAVNAYNKTIVTPFIFFYGKRVYEKIVT